MHLLHKKCGSRVPNQMMCPVCKVVEERADVVCGFELSKGNYVQITVRSWRASRPRPIARLNSASSCRSTSLIPFILRAAITLRPRKARKNRIDSLPRRSKKPAALP